MRRVLLLAGVAAVLVGLSACNAVKGLGRDIESVGQAGDRAI